MAHPEDSVPFGCECDEERLLSGGEVVEVDAKSGFGSDPGISFGDGCRRSVGQLLRFPSVVGCALLAGVQGADGACGCALVGVGWLGVTRPRSSRRLRRSPESRDATTARDAGPWDGANGAFLRWCWVDRCRQGLLSSGPPQVTVGCARTTANITDTGEQGERTRVQRYAVELSRFEPSCDVRRRPRSVSRDVLSGRISKPPTDHHPPRITHVGDVPERRLGDRASMDHHVVGQASVGLVVGWGDPAVTGTASAGGFVLPTGTVAFLLTDVEASTQRWEAEPDAMAAAMERHDAILDVAVSAHGGVRPLAQGEGDSIVAAFSRASDAVFAAAEAQRALTAELLADIDTAAGADGGPCGGGPHCDRRQLCGPGDHSHGAAARDHQWRPDPGLGARP